MRKVFTLLVIVAFIASCGNKEEPFDVLDAQRHMQGIWDCTQGDMEEETYQITVAPYGLLHVAIKNLCKTGEESVLALLESETSLLIQTQKKETFSIDGTGAISEGYNRMVLTLSFIDINGAREVIVTCNKRAVQ